MRRDLLEERLVARREVPVLYCQDYGPPAELVEILDILQDPLHSGSAGGREVIGDDQDVLHVVKITIVDGEREYD
jgi:hypothetical protein